MSGLKVAGKGSWLPALLLVLGATPVRAQTGVALEMRGGASFGSTVEQASLNGPDFRLWPEDVGSSARYEFALLLPPVAGPIRPRLEVSLSPNARVNGKLMDEFARCPSCFEPFEGEVDRIDVIAGAEVPLFRNEGRARPFGTIGIGLRRAAWSYAGGMGTAGVQPSGSFAETDLLGRLGLGVGFGFGTNEISFEAEFRAGPVGSGVIPAERVQYSSDTTGQIDLGRELAFDFGLTLGVRREL